MKQFLLLILLLISAPAWAASDFDMTSFEQLPVLHEGRVKPIDSLGRIQLKALGGGDLTQDIAPAAWIAEILFDPEAALHQKVFAVRSKDLKAQLELSEEQNFFSLLEMRDVLAPTLDKLPALLKKDATTLTPDQTELLRLHDQALGLLQFSATFSQAHPFDLSEEKHAPYLNYWRAMAEAYAVDDANTWASTSNEALGFARSLLKHPDKLEMEILYSQVNLYSMAIALYAFALLFTFIPGRIWPAQMAMGSAVFIHACAVGLRMYILDRPPVGTLYESVLFVSLICALLGLFIANRKSKIENSRASIFAGGVAAIILLGLAPYLVPSGESLEMLAAVLNTNFWLGTHVLMITAGYGICLLGGCLGHVYLTRRAFMPDNKLQQKLLQLIYRISLVGLLFTAIGTILGGIWADQSWGRFWGWDPKENGALLIVLWLIWLQHGRLSGHVRAVPFVAGMAYLNVIVALAWFGVNLLNVGLHSYGFISGIAVALGSFVMVETVVIGGLWTCIRHRERRTDVA